MERCTCSRRWSVRMPLRRGAGDHRVGGGAGPPTTLSGPRSVAVRTHRGTGTCGPYPLPGSASTGGEHAHASSDAAAANSRGYPGLGLSGTNAGTPGGKLPEDTPAWATAVPMRALPEELPEDTPAGATSVPMRALPEEQDAPMLDVHEHVHPSSDAAAASSRGYPGLGLSGTNAGTPGGKLPEDTPAWATAVPMRALPEELPEDTPAGATSVPMRALPEERDEPMLDAPVAPVDSARHSTGDPCRLMLHQGLRT